MQLEITTRVWTKVDALRVPANSLAANSLTGRIFFALSLFRQLLVVLIKDQFKAFRCETGIQTNRVATTKERASRAKIIEVNSG
jgi:hypothetical protein